MKKTITLIITIVLSLTLFTGCSKSIEGEWHCVKYVEDDEVITNEMCKEKLGYGLDKLITATITSDGLGVLKKNDKRELKFDWKKQEDYYVLDFNNSEVDNASARFNDDGLLVISIRGDDHRMVVYLDK